MGMVSAAKGLGARLTQIGGRVKQAPVLLERVAVGHAGDEIGDAARAGALVALRPLAPLGRQVGGLGACSGRTGRDTTPSASPIDAHDSSWR